MKYKQNNNHRTKQEGSSFPCLENASQTTSTLKRMSMKVPEAYLRAKSPNTKGAQDYYKEP